MLPLDPLLGDLDSVLGDCEALQSYGATKSERDALRAKVETLEARFAAEVEANQDLDKRLKAVVELCAKNEARALDAEDERDQHAQDLQNLRETRGLISDTAELSLAEARAAFLVAKDEEIRRRVDERFSALQKDWERRLPQVLAARLSEILGSGTWPPEVAEVIDKESRVLADGVLHDHDRWPDWFRAQVAMEIHAEVKRQMDATFAARVAAGVSAEFDRVKAAEWAQFVRSKASGLCAGLREGLHQLEGDYQFRCDRCGGDVLLRIGHAEIAHLTAGGTLVPQCFDPSCRTPWERLTNAEGHSLTPFRLEDVVAVFLFPPDR